MATAIVRCLVYFWLHYAGSSGGVRQQWWHRARARKVLAEPGLLLRVLPLLLVLLKRRWRLLLHAARCLPAACLHPSCLLCILPWRWHTHPSCVSLHAFITKIVEQKTRFSKVGEVFQRCGRHDVQSHDNYQCEGV